MRIGKIAEVERYAWLRCETGRPRKCLRSLNLRYWRSRYPCCGQTKGAFQVPISPLMLHLRSTCLRQCAGRASLCSGEPSKKGADGNNGCSRTRLPNSTGTKRPFGAISKLIRCNYFSKNPHRVPAGAQQNTGDRPARNRVQAFCCRFVLVYSMLGT